MPSSRNRLSKVKLTLEELRVIEDHLGQLDQQMAELLGHHTAFNETASRSGIAPVPCRVGWHNGQPSRGRLRERVCAAPKSLKGFSPKISKGLCLSARRTWDQCGT